MESGSLNGAGNLTLLIGLAIITVALVWGSFNQGWSGWQITAAIGCVVFVWGWIIVMIAYAAKQSSAPEI